MPRPRRSSAGTAASAGPSDDRPGRATGAGSDLPKVTLVRAVPSSATVVAVPAFSDRLGRVEGVRRAALERAGFTGAAGQSLLLDDGDRARVVLGMGPSAEVGPAALRTAGAALARSLGGHRRAAVELPDGADDAACVAAVVEGFLLTSYRFDGYRSSSRPAAAGLSVVVGDPRAARSGLERALAVAGAVWFARDLVNEPGGALTPAVFAEIATERASAAGLTVEVLDEDAIAAAGLGGIVAVNKGSVQPPRLVHLVYEPAEPGPVLDDGRPVTVALVGKGITFDSGGLSIKPAESMTTMKCDMAGAAAVIAAMCALGALGVRVRVESWTPMTDNMTGGDATRPGDVFTARNGRTVEVLNTDAEGRLVLGDALALAAETRPVAIVDLATLTGACVVALGEHIAGLMGNDDGLVARVQAAAAATGERVWHLPLPGDYRAQLDSDIADLKNIGTRFGGSLTAGLFLQEFVDGVPWVHLDIAGPAFLSGPSPDSPKGATGFGVRTLLGLLEAWAVAGTED